MKKIIILIVGDGDSFYFNKALAAMVAQKLVDADFRNAKFIPRQGAEIKGTTPSLEELILSVRDVSVPQFDLSPCLLEESIPPRHNGRKYFRNISQQKYRLKNSDYKKKSFVRKIIK